MSVDRVGRLPARAQGVAAGKAPVPAQPVARQPAAGLGPSYRFSDIPLEAPAAGAGLPPSLRSGIAQLSGIALDHVGVHYNSSRPKHVDAAATAQDRAIHLAPGKERLLPHEAWHLVQQRQGRVRPTLQMKGVAINDDPALEREADLMGARAARMTPVASVLRPEPPIRGVMPLQRSTTKPKMTGLGKEDDDKKKDAKGKAPLAANPAPPAKGASGVGAAGVGTALLPVASGSASDTQDEYPPDFDNDAPAAATAVGASTKSSSVVDAKAAGNPSANAVAAGGAKGASGAGAAGVGTALLAVASGSAPDAKSLSASTAADRERSIKQFKNFPRTFAASEILDAKPNGDGNCHGFTVNGTMSSLSDGAMLEAVKKKNSKVRVFINEDGKIWHSGRIERNGHLHHFLVHIGEVRSTKIFLEEFDYVASFDLPEEFAQLEQRTASDAKRVAVDDAKKNAGPRFGNSETQRMSDEIHNISKILDEKMSNLGGELVDAETRMPDPLPKEQKARLEKVKEALEFGAPLQEQITALVMELDEGKAETLSARYADLVKQYGVFNERLGPPQK